MEELCREGTFYFDSWMLEEGSGVVLELVIVGEVAYASLGAGLGRRY